MPAPARAAAALPARPSRVPAVTLAAIARAVEAPVAGPGNGGAGATRVTGLSLDSRAVREGDLYAALPGASAHGSVFVREAAAAGAVAVLTDPVGEGPAASSGLPVLVVPDPRGVLGEVAALVYGDPAAGLDVVGVTGTHGKSTVTALAAAGIGACGLVPAQIGTIGTAIGGQPVASRLTTPEAPDLHALFAVMREHDVDACVMEVSSHALVLGRVDGVVFDLAVFTNLGRDHLDFHAGLDDYFQAKSRLFTRERALRALVNVDDDYGRRLVGTCDIPVRTYSADGAEADWKAVEVSLHAGGASFSVVTPAAERRRAAVRLPGAFNVSNALAAIAICAELGLPLDCAVTGVGDLRVVPGRMQRIDEGQPYLVVVDYAHKPDAVAAALTALRALTEGRLAVVLGAGGDRDRGKRSLMGAAAARLADLVIVTDDNPRSEQPAAIRAALLAGAAQVPAADRAELREVPDREEAIATALLVARPGDCVLVAGKGHEQGQEVAGSTHPFDDASVVRAVLRRTAAGDRR